PPATTTFAPSRLAMAPPLRHSRTVQLFPGPAILPSQNSNPTRRDPSRRVLQGEQQVFSGGGSADDESAAVGSATREPRRAGAGRSGARCPDGVRGGRRGGAGRVRQPE